MIRLPGWEAALAGYLEGIRGRRFAWGRHDCCTFAAGAVEAMTGIDPIPEFRGRYTTAIGSARALRRYGAGTLEATLDAKFERVPAYLAQRGDLVMRWGLLGICLGVVMVAVGAEGEREGLVTFPLPFPGSSTAAWRVAFDG